MDIKETIDYKISLCNRISKLLHEFQIIDTGALELSQMLWTTPEDLPNILEIYRWSSNDNFSEVFNGDDDVLSLEKEYKEYVEYMNHKGYEEHLMEKLIEEQMHDQMIEDWVEYDPTDNYETWEDVQINDMVNEEKDFDF